MNTIVMFVPQQQVCNYLTWNMFLNILYFIIYYIIYYNLKYIIFLIYMKYVTSCLYISCIIHVNKIILFLIRFNL